MILNYRLEVLLNEENNIVVFPLCFWYSICAIVGAFQSFIKTMPDALMSLNILNI